MVKTAAHVKLVLIRLKRLVFGLKNSKVKAFSTLRHDLEEDIFFLIEFLRKKAIIVRTSKHAFA